MSGGPHACLVTPCPRSWGLAAGEQRLERIWAKSCGALRWSLAAELRLASKELMAVGAPWALRAPPRWAAVGSQPSPQLRREALRGLLQDERRQHQRELQQHGKAFHVERL